MWWNGRWPEMPTNRYMDSMIPDWIAKMFSVHSTIYKMLFKNDVLWKTTNNPSVAPGAIAWRMLKRFFVLFSKQLRGSCKEFCTQALSISSRLQKGWKRPAYVVNLTFLIVHCTPLRLDRTIVDWGINLNIIWVVFSRCIDFAIAIAIPPADVHRFTD